MTPRAWRSPALIEPGRYDPDFHHELELLHQRSIQSRWLGLGLLWVVVGPVSVWRVRDDIALMVDHFTWASLRYTLAFNPLASLGLVLCFSLTMGVLLWQSRNIFLGLSEHDLKDLEQRLLRIRQQGESHPLWASVCEHRNMSLYYPAKTQP
ncbi:MAG: hypothetical protein AAF327_04385 [Cyanobacteria bacterium P01_A01_bin.37]